ncbi:hypothetical protein [Asticcacaulis biprosthecium]|uniref:hypothetical protein n=1 Tax=Asticcacaulis biprosthecium TaxID=76891 RepID=UPI0012F4FB3C|nr:hypothetical protein [Asticcacaulis biprosthecium]
MIRQIKASRVIKTLAGLALGVVVSTAVALPFTGMVSENLDSEFPETYGSMLLLGSYMVAMFALPVGLVGHAILSALKQRSLIIYALVGAIAGFIYGYVVGIGAERLENTILCSLWAAGCALIAWLIRRPDKDGVVALDTHV